LGVGDTNGGQCRDNGVGIPRRKTSKHKDNLDAKSVPFGSEESLQAKICSNFTANGRLYIVILKHHKRVMPEHELA
jgi:hypothetical protein